MESTTTGRRIARRLAYGTAAASLLGLAFAGAASAAPFVSSSSALAVSVKPVGGGVTDSVMRHAANDGTDSVVFDSNSPNLSVLGTQSVVVDAKLAQMAIARADGIASACAGLTAGVADLGDVTKCAPPPVEGVFTINLEGRVQLKAQVIQQTCTVSNGVAAPSTSTSIVAATITDGVDSFDLPANPTADTDLLAMLPMSLRNQLTSFDHITLNEQSSSTGVINGTALDAFSNTGNRVLVGAVSCGPVADAAPSPMIAKSAAPASIALGGAALAGLVLYRRRRGALVDQS